jgi:hypothetical protein
MSLNGVCQARKALRALRSLVKIQALVRGYLVRKQTAMTLRRLQTLVRLQADSIAVKKASSYRRSMEQVVNYSSFVYMIWMFHHSGEPGSDSNPFCNVGEDV